MDYLLDTNICIYIIKHKPAVVRQRFAALKKTQVYLSSISVFELAFGIENGQPGKRNRQALNQFLAPLEIIEFGKEDALYAARIRAALKRMGTPIGPYDLQIAAIALSRNLTLVTNNTKEFERVDGLKLENWVR